MRKYLVLSIVIGALTISAQALVGISYKGKVEVKLPPEQQQKQEQMTKEDQAMMKSMGLGNGLSGFQFEAKAENGKYKMTYTTGFAIFPKGSYILGDAKARVGYIVFPERQEYVKLDIDELQGTANKLSSSVHMQFENEHVEVTPLPPEVISGLPCTGKRIKVSYDVKTRIMGMHHKSHIEETTDFYSTSKYDVMAAFGDRNWQAQGIATGDPGFDKTIAAKVGFLGFPVRVRTEKTTDGKPEATTILTTEDVHMTPIAPGTFDLPAGYKETKLGARTVFKNMFHPAEQPQNQNGENATGEQQNQGEQQPAQQEQQQEQQKKKKHSWKDLLKKIGG